MSTTLVCLTESLLHPQDIKSELAPSVPSNHNVTLRTEVNDKIQACSLVDSDNQNKDTWNETMSKQFISRKREASCVLVESVKRRDNSRTHDLQSNVPLSQSNQDIPLRTNNYSDFSFEHNSVEECVSNMDVSPSDLSDSSSVADSGIGISSKSSSPCHSIDTSSG